MLTILNLEIFYSLIDVGYLEKVSFSGRGITTLKHLTLTLHFPDLGNDMVWEPQQVCYQK